VQQVAFAAIQAEDWVNLDNHSTGVRISEPAVWGTLGMRR
jgi:hypothetical protein